MTMAATVQVMHSSVSSNRQQVPSTAPVLEFACLFTRDLRRKQKRWQDGRLKYHTFNKRIMVYDDHGNFVGDTHWREDYELNDGDEVGLERGGVIVQVSECTGSRDQDLSELVDKRAQEKAERQAAALARRSHKLESAASPQTAIPHFQLRHKPLHHLIGTPTRHHGRALMPTESPYEERQKTAASPQDDTVRPAKRRKRELSPPSKGGYAQSLFGAALTLSGTPTSTPLIRSRLPKASPDPDHHDEDSGSTLIQTCTTATARTPGAAILNKISRVSEALVQDIDKVQFASLPVESTSSNKLLGLKQKGGSRSRIMEDGSPLHLTSANLNTAGLDHDKSTPAQLKGKHGELNDVPSVTSSRNKNPEYPSLVSRSKTSVRSQGLSTVPRLQLAPKATSCNQGLQELDQEQSMSEPRTELRIKPRKKRGLLMISEKLETRNSSSLRVKKSRIDHQDPIILLGDEMMRHTNNNVSARDGPLDVGENEDNHSQQKKKGAIHSIEAVDKGLPRADLHGPNSTVNHNCNMVDLQDTGNFPRRLGSSDEEPIPTHSVSSTKSKSKKRQDTKVRRYKQGIPIEEGSSDVPDIPSTILRGRDEHLETASYSLHDNKHNKRAMMLEPTPKESYPVDIARSPIGRNQPSKNKWGALTEDNIDSPVVERHDEKRAIYDEEGFLPDSLPAPRLAHLGRKSIRSREVIGFIFDGEDTNDRGGLPRSGDGSKCGKGNPTDNLSVNHAGGRNAKSDASRTNMTTKNRDRINANDQCQNNSSARDKEIVENCTSSRPIDCQDTYTTGMKITLKLPRKQVESEMVQINVPKPENTTAVLQPSSRIVTNPATRGKKAAKPSDAAGQVPQCPLPSEAAARIPSASGKHENNTRRSRLENQIKEVTIGPIPGFARANGGPWSREAHDLFEFTRPS
ncbi:hypothetical protein F4805DRAFT_446744 [Annulohypoxylon moriforme]|nr:hypothetical protein F4805DRAFT_446744 [Annulohypoxylon moriforme]